MYVSHLECQQTIFHDTYLTVHVRTYSNSKRNIQNSVWAQVSFPFSKANMSPFSCRHPVLKAIFSKLDDDNCPSLPSPFMLFHTNSVQTVGWGELFIFHAPPDSESLGFLFWQYMACMALVGEQTILTERPPLVCEVSANFCRKMVLRLFYLSIKKMCIHSPVSSVPPPSHQSSCTLLQI
jgi:hypothetical protein